MPRVKRPLKLQLRDYLKTVNPKQRELLYRYLRTGRRFKELEQEHIEKFSELGLKILEAGNRTRKKPYEARLSEAERKVVEIQARHLVKLLYPKANRLQEKLLIEKLVKNTNLVSANDVNELIREGHIIGGFSVGRLFYDATKPRQAHGKKSKGKKRRIYAGAIAGTQYTNKIILNPGWMKDPYDRTTPFHEMVHIVTGASEYKVLVADYYYSLRHGIMEITTLKKRVSKSIGRQKAMQKAIQLFNLANREGPGKADEELRKFIKPPDIKTVT